MNPLIRSRRGGRPRSERRKGRRDAFPDDSRFVRVAAAARRRSSRYAIALLVFAIAAAWNLLTAPLIEPAPYFLYLTAAVVAGLLGGVGPALMVTAFGAAAVAGLNDIRPPATLRVAATPYELRLGLFVASGALVSVLTHWVRRAARKAREDERRFRELVHGVLDYAIILLDEEGRVRSWNLGAEKTLGYSAEEILGSPFSRFYPPEERSTERQDRELERALREGRYEEEGWRVRKDGSRFWAHVLVNAVSDADGRLLGFSRIVRDLTERKAIEDAMRAKDEELRRHARELERAVGDLEAFTYTVSHDLRAPLRAMEGFVHFALQRAGAALDGEARGMLERAAGSAARLDRLIRDLLSYSQVNRAEVRTASVDLDGTLAHALEAAAAPAGSVHVRRPLGRARANESLLLQALTNLIANALKFVPEGRPPRVEIASERRDGSTVLSVIDNGIGVPAASRESIFQPFMRLNAERYEGTGIGLAIARRAVEKMGGRIGVESDEGKGSRFWIALPEAP